MTESMTEYEREMLAVERQRTKIEFARLFILPLTILATLMVAWAQIHAVKERNDLAASNRFEVALMTYIEKTTDKCLAKDLLVKMYEHNANERDRNRNGTLVWQWYYNYKELLEDQCKKKK